MSAAMTASARRADRQQRASSSTHVIWGGLENSSSTENSGHLSSEIDAKKRIIARKIQTEGIELLSDSATDSASLSKDDSGKTPKEEKARGAKRDAAAASSSAAAAASPSAAAAGDADELEELPPGPPPSAGSAAHVSGHCKPCLFLFEKIGCQYGAQCTFCHYPHSRRIGARQSKGKRDRFKKLLAKVEATQDNEAVAGQSGRAQKNMMSL